ncbi:MAG: NADH-quinone oxidoreductase subunit M [Actinomycetota bacterium]|nr:NADH-quinone oxidoreductase subunit M [Actinomycetota bacterium]
MSDFPWLSVLVGVPAVGALLVGLVPRQRGVLAKALGLSVSLLTLGLTIVVALLYRAGEGQFRLTEQYGWVERFGLYWSLGVDGVALALIALTAVVTPVVLVGGWDEAEPTGRSGKGFVFLVLVLEAMTLGAFAATDVLAFYILFEAMLVPMYLLIGSYGGPRRSYAAVKFLLYNLLGGLVMLAAVIGLYAQSATLRPGGGTFLLSELVGLPMSAQAQYWIFAGFMVAFAIKAPLWPFHSWLPDAAGEATPSTAAFLSGVMDKVGTFGMIHLCLPLFPQAARDLAPVIVTLAVVSILYGALVAIGQSDMIRLVAYASISHFGFIVLGIFALTSQGGAGATLYMVNHGLSTVALFLVVGFLVTRRGSRAIADFGGVQRPAPVLAGVLLVVALATLSLPGLATFVSEFLVLVGTFTRYPVAAVFAVLGVVLAAVYTLWMYQRVMTGPVHPTTEGMRDMRGREALAVAPLLALLLVLGLYPKPLLDVINEGVAPTLAQVDVVDPEPVAPATAEGATE